MKKIEISIDSNHSRYFKDVLYEFEKDIWLECDSDIIEYLEKDGFKVKIKSNNKGGE